MGIIDRIKRLFTRKKSTLDDPRLPERRSATRELSTTPITKSDNMSGLKAEVEIIHSQIENMRIQHEAINARLQNIERLVNEIRGFCE